MMERVLQNLVENAVKNTPFGGIINVWLSVENNYLVFHIENTGVPLTGEMLTWINSPAANDDPVTKPSRSGLGLVIVRKILYRHGAQLQANVTVESNNIFSFRLPIITPQSS